MGKFANYILLMSGLMVLFYFFGLIDGSISGNLLGVLLNGESIKVATISVIGASALAGIASAFISKFQGNFRSDLVIFSAFIPILAGYLADFVVIYTTVAAISQILAVVVLSPLMVLFTLTVYEWWRGTTT